MKTKILFLSILLGIMFNLNSQEVCGTANFSSENQNTTQRNVNTTNNNPICINVSFHIIRDNDGNSGIDSNQLDSIITYLNQVFSSFNISFIKSGFEFINNTAFQQIGDNAEAISLVNLNNHPNSINYYIVESLWNTPSGYITGTAITTPSNSLIIRKDKILSSTSPHEIGHCLNLLHTFETSYCMELINGTNCHSCGDKVCDTPADAQFGNLNGYTPDLTNIMSYYQNRTHFTNGQSNRMKYALQNFSLLQQVISNNCSIPEISSINHLCYSDNKTLTISNVQNYTTTWEVSSNITILTNSNSSITMRAKYPNSLGNGWVKVVMSNGTNLQVYFKVGIPNSSLITLASFRSIPIYSGRFTNITARYNGVIDVGQLGYTWEWIVPSSQVRYHGNNISYIHVSPPESSTGIYIKTRSVNECGCSDWSGRWFTINAPPSGCTNCPTDNSEIHY